MDVAVYNSHAGPDHPALASFLFLRSLHSASSSAIVHFLCFFPRAIATQLPRRSRRRARPRAYLSPVQRALEPPPAQQPLHHNHTHAWLPLPCMGLLASLNLAKQGQGCRHLHAQDPPLQVFPVLSSFKVICRTAAGRKDPLAATPYRRLLDNHSRAPTSLGAPSPHAAVETGTLPRGAPLLVSR